MRNLPPEVRELFHSDMRLVVDMRTPSAPLQQRQQPFPSELLTLPL